MNAHRGFDGLSTTAGVALMSLAFLFIIAVCVVGGLFWRAAARADRDRRAEARDAKPPEPTEPPASLTV